MVEELLEFRNTIEDREGRSHVATVWGAEREDGKWIGWIRFTRADGETLETDRETTQPNRDDLAYWSTGLTYFYLEGALVRARDRAERRRRDERVAAAAPGAGSGKGGPGSHTAPPRERGVPRIEARSASPHLPETIMGVREPRPGTSRDVPGAGIIVYEGSRADPDGWRHVFAVQYGSDNAGATLANWLWSRLHTASAVVRVNGEPIELTNDALKRAIVGV